MKVHIKNDMNAHVCELNYKSYIGYLTEMIVKTAVVYVVGPRNMFAIHHREVRGGDEIAARGDHQRATHVAREGAYEERHERSCM